MRKTIIWMMLLVFSSGAVFAQKAERKHVREGNGLYNKKKYTEAEIAYRKSLEVNPRSVEGTYNLGNALYKQKKYSEAGQQYQLLGGRAEKIAKMPEGKTRLAQVFHNMGNIGMQSKQYAQSVEAYKQSLRFNPDDNQTRYNLALAQKLLKDQQNQQKQDQNKDKNKDKNKDQNKQNQQQDQQSKQDNKKDNKTQKQPQQNEEMSKDNAQQMLDAFLQDEKNTQEKVKKAQAQQQQRRKIDKQW